MDKGKQFLNVLRQEYRELVSWAEFETSARMERDGKYEYTPDEQEFNARELRFAQRDAAYYREALRMMGDTDEIESREVPTQDSYSGTFYADSCVAV